jgi:hypothetical protein
VERDPIQCTRNPECRPKGLYRVRAALVRIAFHRVPRRRREEGWAVVVEKQSSVLPFGRHKNVPLADLK